MWRVEVGKPSSMPYILAAGKRLLGVGGDRIIVEDANFATALSILLDTYGAESYRDIENFFRHFLPADRVRWVKAPPLYDAVQ